jgi:hypothetical protein
VVISNINDKGKLYKSLILDITTCKDQRQAIQIINNIKIPQSVSYFEYSIKILPFSSIATLRTFSLNSAKAVRYGITS